LAENFQISDQAKEPLLLTLLQALYLNRDEIGEAPKGMETAFGKAARKALDGIVVKRTSIRLDILD